MCESEVRPRKRLSFSLTSGSIVASEWGSKSPEYFECNARISILETSNLVGCFLEKVYLLSGYVIGPLYLYQRR